MAPEAAVLAIVEVPRPQHVPGFAIRRKMRESIPEYEGLSGLEFKAYSLARASGSYGGLYLWSDGDSAHAWFSPDWFERVERERGVTPKVRFFRVLSIVDTVPGGTPRDSRSKTVASLLMLSPKSVFADFSSQSLQGFVAADQHVPGLLRRYRVMDADGRSGVLSIWQNAAAAKSLMNNSTESEAEWFDTPILLPSILLSNKSGEADSERAP